MVLRKHLEGGRLIKIEQPQRERILRLEIEAHDELGELTTKVLVCEIMGKHSNLILLDGKTGIILDGIKRYSHALSRHREVLPGKAYLAPPAQDKTDPLEIRPENFRQLIWPGNWSQSVARAIFQKLAGVSLTLAREIVYRANLPAQITLEECGDYELTRLEQAFGQIRSAISGQTFQPTLILNAEQEPLEYAAVNLQHLAEPPNQSQVFLSISELLNTYYQLKERQHRWQVLQNALNRHVAGHLEKAGRKSSLREDSLIEVQEAERYRLFGDLLMTNLYQISSGAEAVTVANLYKPGEPPVTIPLDERLSPLENAQHYFKLYGKARRSLQVVEEQLQLVQADIAYLESVSQSIEMANTLEDLEEIRLELVEQGYLKAHTAADRRRKTALKPTGKEYVGPAGKPSGRKQHPSAKKGAAGKGKGKTGKAKDQSGLAAESALGSGLLSVRSSDGYEILVGKNNKQNDYLTLKLARKQDIWLHVKDIPGSHVIIRANPPGAYNNENEKNEFNYENINEATPATAAAGGGSADDFERNSGKGFSGCISSDTSEDSASRSKLKELIPELNIPVLTLREAALLAAYFSKARYSGSVPVDYALRRNVRKPAGAKPGYVIYDHQQTVYVTPSPENLGDLLKLID